jgi:hypothetical protein
MRKWQIRKSLHFDSVKEKSRIAKERLFYKDKRTGRVSVIMKNLVKQLKSTGKQKAKRRKQKIVS